MESVSAKQLKQVLDGDGPFELVDVRSNKDYQHNHIPKAVNVPFVDDFPDVLEDTLMSGKDILVIAYNSHEESDAAKQAVKVMEEKMGYTNVKYLEGGIMGWMEEGFKVEFGRES